MNMKGSYLILRLSISAMVVLSIALDRFASDALPSSADKKARASSRSANGSWRRVELAALIGAVVMVTGPLAEPTATPVPDMDAATTPTLQINIRE